jgi:uncharacterized DUF497 family protein
VPIFAGFPLERDDTRRAYGEARSIAIGEVAGVVLTVVYTDRADSRRHHSPNHFGASEQSG